MRSSNMNYTGIPLVEHLNSIPPTNELHMYPIWNYRYVLTTCFVDNMDLRFDL